MSNLPKLGVVCAWMVFVFGAFGVYFGLVEQPLCGEPEKHHGAGTALTGVAFMVIGAIAAIQETLGADPETQG